MKYWLDLGASGFCVDMANSLIKGDPSFREITRLWQEFRAWLDAEYPEAILVSEWSEPDKAIPAGYHIDFYIHFGNPGYTSLLRKSNNGSGLSSSPYGFSFFDSSGHGNILEFHDDFYPRYLKSKDLGYISIPTGNHDITPRLAKGHTLQELEVVYIFLLSMPGVPFIYYGDEIGIQGIENLPSVEGGYNRTEARTPMQWDHSMNAGFSTAPAASLYTPVENDPGNRTVADQEQNPASLLHIVRRLIEMRCTHPALCASGEYIPVYAKGGEYPFAYLRRSGEETLLVAVNPSHHPVEVSLEGVACGETHQLLYGKGNLYTTGGMVRIKLPGTSGGIWQL
jgi:maltose alpha-D-glucosyltransferase / alpha-amylase